MAKIPSRKIPKTKRKIASSKFPKSQSKIPSRQFAEGTAKIPSRKFSKASNAEREKPGAKTLPDRPANEIAREVRVATLKGKLPLKSASTLPPPAKLDKQVPRMK